MNQWVKNPENVNKNIGIHSEFKTSLTRLKKENKKKSF